MVKPELISEVKRFYSSLSEPTLSSLSKIYDSKIEFKDPVGDVKGIEALESYFKHGLANADSCKFVISDYWTVENTLILKWHMKLFHKKLNRGREVHVEGMSHLTTNKEGLKVVFHQDFFDLGAMVYEQIPLLGKLIQSLKRRMKG